jgi:hypothetical protein
MWPVTWFCQCTQLLSVQGGNSCFLCSHLYTQMQNHAFIVVGRTCTLTSAELGSKPGSSLLIVRASYSIFQGLSICIYEMQLSWELKEHMKYLAQSPVLSIMSYGDNNKERERREQGEGGCWNHRD